MVCPETVISGRHHTIFSVEPLQRVRTVCNIFVEINHLMLIGCAHQRRGDNKIRGRPGIGDGNIINLSDTEQGLHIGVVGRCGQWVGEEDDQVNSSFHNFCADLLVTA